MMDSIVTGIVVAVYPEGNSIDVLLPSDGSRLSNVQVMVPTGSSDTGLVDLPDVGLPADDSRWDIKGTPERYIRACLGSYRGVPVCLGFLLPQENEISFQHKNRRIMRHASDVYTTIDQAGNAELYHPSGTYLRIGTAAAHEDLTGADYDKKWAIAKNTDRQVHVQLTVANGGSVKASINIAPDGNITVQHVGDLSVTTEGKADISVGGDADVTVGGNLTADVTGDADVTAASLSVNCDTAIDGNLTVTGNVSDASGSMQEMRDTYNSHTNPSNGSSPPPQQMT